MRLRGNVYLRLLVNGALNMFMFAGVCAAGYLGVYFLLYPLLAKRGNAIVAQTGALLCFIVFIAVAAFVFVAAQKRPSIYKSRATTVGYRLLVCAYKAVVCGVLGLAALFAIHKLGDGAPRYLVLAALFALYYAHSVLFSALIYIGGGFLGAWQKAALCVIRRGVAISTAMRILFALAKLCVFTIIAGAVALIFDPPGIITGYAGIAGIGADSIDLIYACGVSLVAVFALRFAYKPLDMDIRAWIVRGTPLSNAFGYIYDFTLIYIAALAAVFAIIHAYAPISAIIVSAGVAAAGVFAIYIPGFRILGKRSLGFVILCTISE